jgi:hypothetical protein
MSIKTRMLKDTRLSSGEDTTDSTRDGELSILTKPVKKELVDTTHHMDSTSIDYSISDQDSQ